MIKHGLRPCLILFCIEYQSGYFIGLNNYEKYNARPINFRLPQKNTDSNWVRFKNWKKRLL